MRTVVGANNIRVTATGARFEKDSRPYVRLEIDSWPFTSTVLLNTEGARELANELLDAVAKATGAEL
jgi:hypothetical protein